MKGWHQTCRMITCLYMRKDAKAEDWHAVRGADDLPPRGPNVPSGTQDSVCSVQTKNRLRVLRFTCKETEQRLGCGNSATTLGLTSVSDTEEPLVWNLLSSEMRAGQKKMKIFCWFCTDLLWKSCDRGWKVLQKSQQERWVWSLHVVGVNVTAKGQETRDGE